MAYNRITDYSVGYGTGGIWPVLSSGSAADIGFFYINGAGVFARGVPPGQAGYVGWIIRADVANSALGGDDDGLPHGPLVIQGNTLTTKYTSDSSGSSIIQALGEPFSISASPSFLVDLEGNVAVVLCSLTAPGYVTDSGNYETSSFVGITNPSGGVGLWNFFGGAPPYVFIANKFANQLQPASGWGWFPAFDMSDTWYSALSVTSVIGGAASTYTVDLTQAEDYINPDGSFNNFNSSQFSPSEEYDPVPGFTIETQSSSERVWSRQNSSGGIDTITITLLNEVDPDESFSEALGDTFTYFDLGQAAAIGQTVAAVDIYGLTLTNTIYTAGAPGYPTTPTSITTTMVPCSADILVLNSDGTMSLVGVSIPDIVTDDDGNVTAGGELLNPSTGGGIALAIGNFTAPTDTDRGGIQLFAEV